MRMKMVPSIAIAAALALGTPALANTPPAAPDALALEALRNYAACAVKLSPRGAEALMTMDLGNDTYQRAMHNYAKGFGRCAKAGDQLRFSGLPFAGDIAEALLAQKYTAADLASAVTRPLPVARSIPEAVGACVAHAKPSEVMAVFGTAPGSHEEVAALQATGDALGPCIPAGKTMSLNKPAVRAMYALGAYHILTAPAAEAAPQG